MQCFGFNFTKPRNAILKGIKPLNEGSEGIERFDIGLTVFAPHTPFPGVVNQFGVLAC